MNQPTRSQHASTLLDLIRGDRIIVAPGAYDALSARLIERVGFPVVYMTGYGVAASRVGFPDMGLATLGEMTDGLRALRRVVSIPIVADGDTGFGNVLNVRRAVAEYEAAGASAIQIEDQVFPKRCGHTLGREVIPAEEMVSKIRAALDARRSETFLVVARTDARTHLGFEEALRRGRLYAGAGADLVFVESPESERELARIPEEIPAPVVANLVEGGRTPLLTIDRLERLGFRLAILPISGLLAAARSLRRLFEELRRTGDPCSLRAELEGFTDLSELVGFPEAEDFLRRYG